MSPDVCLEVAGFSELATAVKERAVQEPFVVPLYIILGRDYHPIEHLLQPRLLLPRRRRPVGSFSQRHAKGIGFALVGRRIICNFLTTEVARGGIVIDFSVARYSMWDYFCFGRDTLLLRIRLLPTHFHASITQL
jgi:hypothetical protein